MQNVFVWNFYHEFLDDRLVKRSNFFLYINRREAKAFCDDKSILPGGWAVTKTRSDTKLGHGTGFYDRHRTPSFFSRTFMRDRKINSDIMRYRPRCVFLLYLAVLLDISLSASHRALKSCKVCSRPFLLPDQSRENRTTQFRYPMLFPCSLNLCHRSFPSDKYLQYLLLSEMRRNVSIATYFSASVTSRHIVRLFLNR